MIHRGEIYFVSLDPTVGREQAGHRPVVVLSVDEINRLPLVVVVVAGTSGRNIARDYPTNIRVLPDESGLLEETVFLGFQLRSIDPRRFPLRPAERLSPTALKRVEGAVIHCLGLQTTPY